MGTLKSVVTQSIHRCLAFVLNHVPDANLNEPESIPAKIDTNSRTYQYMIKMYEKLRYPKARELFYHDPSAYAQLLNLIDYATKYQKKSYELMFKDYLFELEDTIEAPKKRLHKLLQSLVEAKYGKPIGSLPFEDLAPENHCARVEEEAPTQPEKTSFIVTNNGRYREMPFWYYFSDDELDEFCHHFESLQLEDEDSSSEQKAKRSKLSDSLSSYIPSIESIEQDITPVIWQAQDEVRCHFFTHYSSESWEENQKKKRNVHSLF